MSPDLTLDPFRFADDNVDFFPKFKALIESTYEVNGKKRVMLLAHSLGNLYVLYFLKRMTPQWKKKYVRTYVAVSAPIGGSVKPLVLETCGKKCFTSQTDFSYTLVLKTSLSMKLHDFSKI